MLCSTLLLLPLFKLAHTTDTEYPNIEKLFSVTSDSREEMESARKSGITQNDFSLNLENIRSLLARDNRSTDADNTYYSSLKKLQRVIEDTRKSGAVVNNFAFDVEHLDINRIEKKLQDLESTLNNEKLSLNDTRKQILYPPPLPESYWYQLTSADPKPYRENKEFSEASRYVMKTKIMDMMLQLIFMARHKIKYLEKTKEFTQVDTSFRIAFLYSKMTLIRRRFWRILSTCRIKHDPDNERDKEPFDYVEIYLILHHKAVKLHVDFVYLYDLVLKIHTMHQEKHRVTAALTVPEYHKATVGQRTATTPIKKDLTTLSASLAADEVPHAAELADILSKTVFKNSSTDAGIFFDITGNATSNTFDFRSFSDNLELRKLDLETLRKIIAMAATKDKGYRRAYYDERRDWEYEYANPLFFGSRWPKMRPGSDIIAKLLNLMKQSIYFVRDRVQVTKPYRVKLDNDVRYRIGVLLGTVHELMLKLDNVYATLKHLNLEKVNFIYFLMIYERFLTLHTDVTNTVENVFKLHRRWALRVTTKKHDVTVYKPPKPGACVIPKEFDSSTDDQTLRYQVYLMENPSSCQDATVDKASYDSGKKLFNDMNPPTASPQPGA